jgi:hypothetical protein
MAIFSTTWAIPVFVIGVALTTVTLVVDDACVAARRASWQLTRNGFFAAAKLALLPLGVVTLARTNGIQILAPWVFATLVSFWFVRRLVFVRGRAQVGRLVDLSLIRSHGHLAIRHHWLNVSVQAPRFAIVAGAAIVVGPTLTAAFYAALLMIGFVTMIPNLLTTVLFALTTGDEAALREQVRFTLAISLLIAVVAAPTVYFISGFALSLFSPADLAARTGMWILGLTVAPFTVKTHFVAVARVRGQMGRAARLTSAGAIVEVALAILGGVVGGITGIALGWLIAACIEAVAFGPSVYHAALSTPSSRDLSAAG